jgi:hypothetical protein
MKPIPSLRWLHLQRVGGLGEALRRRWACLILIRSSPLYIAHCSPFHFHLSLLSFFVFVCQNLLESKTEHIAGFWGGCAIPIAALQEKLSRKASILESFLLYYYDIETGVAMRFYFILPFTAAFYARAGVHNLRYPFTIYKLGITHDTSRGAPPYAAVHR